MHLQYHHRLVHMVVRNAVDQIFREAVLLEWSHRLYQFRKTEIVCMDGQIFPTHINWKWKV